MIKLHKKIYFEFFGYGEQSFIPCEICGGVAVDVHHSIPRGRGGSKTKDYIENLIGVCRSCHNKCEDGKISKEEQMEIHLRFIEKFKKEKAL